MLLLLRHRYFPAFGAHMGYHRWTEFGYAWRHPAAYLELQNTLNNGFWSFMKTVFLAIVNAVTGELAVSTSKLPPATTTTQPWIRHTASTYALFYSMCTVDRSMFAIAAALATLSACGQLMFRDVETVAGLFRFSIFFWFGVLLQLVFSIVKLGALEKGGGLGRSARHRPGPRRRVDFLCHLLLSSSPASSGLV